MQQSLHDLNLMHLVDDVILLSYSVQSVSSFQHHLRCTIGKRMDFHNLKTNASRWIFQIILTVHMCETIARLVHHLASHDEGLAGFNFVCCSDTQPLHFFAVHLYLNCRGRWGTTGDFTTIFIHFLCSPLPSGT